MTVRQTQHLLAYLGYYTGAVDGIWGTISLEAVKRFQQDFGNVTVDGIPGAETQAALKQAVVNGIPQKALMEQERFWDRVRYWTREEFRCHCGGKYCNGFPKEPERTLVELVDDLRAEAGRPAHASSGLRCSTWNAIQGGVANSRHMEGKALDFSVEGMSGNQLLSLAQRDPRTRYAYIIDGGWIHVDVE